MQKQFIKYLFISPLLIIFLLFANNQEKTTPSAHILVSLSNDLNTMKIQAHFNEHVPRYLHIASNDARRYLKNFTAIGEADTVAIQPQDQRIVIPENKKYKSYSYLFDVAKAMSQGGWGSARRVNHAMLLPPDLWLWQPLLQDSSTLITVEFSLPRGVNICVPWPKIAVNTFRLPNTPFDWPCAIAIGNMLCDTLNVPGSVFDMSLIESKQASMADMKKWIRNAARSVCNVYGFFPVSRMQILLVPSGRNSEAVPFAQVFRGGGLGGQFFINPTRPLEEFIGDWTATHELSHTLLPYVKRSDAWLSEGLATYYQYVLMGRDGRLNEQETWQRIYNGFQRGIRNSNGSNLFDASQNMYRNHRFRFIYWSGAAIILRADIQIRRQSDNSQNLGTVLRLVHDKCLGEKRMWGARELLQEMDKLYGSEIFIPLYEKYVFSKDFPVDDRYLDQLGINIRDGQVKLTNNAPLSKIREDILRLHKYKSRTL